MPRENYELGLPAGLIFCDSRAVLRRPHQGLARGEQVQHPHGSPSDRPAAPRRRRGDGISVEAPFAVYQTDQEGGPASSPPGSTATASSPRPAASNSATSWSCSTPSRCRACSRRRCERSSIGLNSLFVAPAIPGTARKGRPIRGRGARACPGLDPEATACRFPQIPACAGMTVQGDRKLLWRGHGSPDLPWANTPQCPSLPAGV